MGASISSRSSCSWPLRRSLRRLPHGGRDGGLRRAAKQLRRRRLPRAQDAAHRDAYAEMLRDGIVPPEQAPRVLRHHYLESRRLEPARRTTCSVLRLEKGAGR
jgi:hypothetical protein